MIQQYLVIILILSFLIRNYSSQDKLKFWILILLIVIFFRKPILNIYNQTKNDNFTNSVIAKPMLLYKNNTIEQLDNKFNNFTNKLFIVGNRNTTSLNNTKNKNIN